MIYYFLIYNHIETEHVLVIIIIIIIIIIVL